MLNLTRLTIQRAREERLPQVAGSLTFTTILSIVPLLAVSFALFTRFPVFHQFGQALEQHFLRNLLPGDLARTVLRHLARFATNANGLTLVGSLFVLVSAVAMLLTVENALNQIWQVKKNRPFLKRVGLYLLMIAVGPPVLGLSLWATSYVYLLSEMLGLIGELPKWSTYVLNLGPMLLGMAAASALFRYVPNTHVPRHHALVGGLIASIGFELGKRAFANYVLAIPTYKTVYGGFAAFPIFLLWVYYSWLVTLAAALVTANLARPSPSKPPPRRKPARA